MILIKPISPVAADLFGFPIRWYALAYIAAFVLGLWIMKRLDKNHDKKYWDDLFTWVIIGVIAGGRLGYVLFYNLSFFIENPLEIFMIWHGGMAFHGGLAGVILAILFFARRRREKALDILDKISVAAPIGLFFGRIANFINMEVMGRETARSWGIVFIDTGDIIPRHPSPLYEAGLEGVLLFIIMLALWPRLRGRTGALSGAFGILYGIFRIICEQFREPDSQVGFLLGTEWLTMGTVLSAAMVIAGIFLITKSKKDK